MFPFDDARHERDGSAESVRAWIYKLAHDDFDLGRERVLVQVTGLTVQGIIAEARKRGVPNDAYPLAWDTIRLIYELDLMLHPEEQSAAKRAWMWSHLGGGCIPQAGQEDKYRVEAKEVERLAAAYLNRPWMQHDYIDWCIVDALVRFEWAEFHRGSPRVFGFTRFILYGGIAIRLTSPNFAPGRDWKTLLFICSILIAFWDVSRNLLGLSGRRARSLRVMRETYASLGGAVLSPTRVREALEAAKAKGVIYSHALWPIIDSAVGRNPNVWRVMPEANPK